VTHGIDLAQVRRWAIGKTTMHNEYLVVHNRCQRKNFKDFNEHPIYNFSILADAFVVESSTLEGAHHIHVIILVVATVH
jgi:hypothetical protein